ncbi:MAG: stage V sporulation protein AB [Cellulosilyticaceae bacterium]
MKLVIARILSIIWGAGTGVVFGTAIVSFLSMIGVIPRLATKPKIRSHYLALGTAASLGITVGTILYIWEVYLPLPSIIIGLFALAFGMFVGCLAVAIAEVLDVIPIMKRRFKLKKGVHLIILMLALGKLVGALYYWVYPGFLSVCK